LPHALEGEPSAEKKVTVSWITIPPPKLPLSIMQSVPLLLCFVIFVLLGAMPSWPYHRSWSFREANWSGAFLLIAAVTFLFSHP
jgi:hypothetical protein